MGEEETLVDTSMEKEENVIRFRYPWPIFNFTVDPGMSNFDKIDCLRPVTLSNEWI